MLIAEIHGHRVPEALNSEDYLTSAVFGHLRYLRPSMFWKRLFSEALAMPGTGSATLTDALHRLGVDLSVYESLDVRFWSTHPIHGCPDVILVFTGPEIQPLVLVVEAKLWADKSGTGEDDQLARYLRLLGDSGCVTPRLPQEFVSAVIYLTEHDSLQELEDSVRAGAARDRLFQLQWQDILEAALHSMRGASGNEKLILQDVAAFLRSRNLEYFRGFRIHELQNIQVQSMDLFRRALFTENPLPFNFTPESIFPKATRPFLAHSALPNSFTIHKGSWV